MLLSCALHGQKYFEEVYEKEGIKHVVIENFEGDISVHASTSNQIKISATLESKIAENSLALEEYKTEALIYLYIKHPCKPPITNFDPQDPFVQNRSIDDCHWTGNEKSFPHLSYSIEIPEGVNIYVSTVMDSKIDISNIDGKVYAANVNGPIKMTNVSKVSNGTTVNGDIEILYNHPPQIEGKFTTINGEINISVPERSSLTTQFKSFMGALYTDLDAEKVMNESVAKSELHGGEMIKIEDYSRAKIGQGEVNMIIETFNGNAYLRKNKI